MIFLYWLNVDLSDENIFFIYAVGVVSHFIFRTYELFQFNILFCTEFFQFFLIVGRHFFAGDHYFVEIQPFMDLSELFYPAMYFETVYIQVF